MHPRSADDIWELFDPMLSLYRYILIAKHSARSVPLRTGSGDPIAVTWLARDSLKSASGLSLE